MDYKKLLFELIESEKICSQRKKTDFETIVDALKTRKYFCIFSAGKIAGDYVGYFTKMGIKIDFLCDNDSFKQGKQIWGIPCISFNELVKYKNDVVINISSQYFQEIRNQLLEHGFNCVYFVDDYFNQLAYRDYFFVHNLLTDSVKLLAIMDYLYDDRSKEIFYKIIDKRYVNTDKIVYSEICTEDEYFPENIFRFDKDECFIDAGAYDGGTIMQFIKNVNNQFNKIFAFELDINNYNILSNNISKSPFADKIVCVNKGLSNRNDIVRYTSEGEASGITDSGELTGEIVRLDHFFIKEEAVKVTYMKLDIEGAELESIHGASEIIRRDHPKLAVCVYHRPDHLVEIPLLLKKLVPEYKLYIRHHFILGNGTVLYATL